MKDYQDKVKKNYLPKANKSKKLELELRKLRLDWSNEAIKPINRLGLNDLTKMVENSSSSSAADSSTS